MKTGLYAALVAALCVAAAPAMAAEWCNSLADVKGKAVKHNYSWTVLTDTQRVFVEGLYVATPPLSLLPYGDKAAVQYSEDDDGALIYFIDGDKACGPFPIPTLMMKMVMAIGNGYVRHAPAPEHDDSGKIEQ